MPVSLSCVIFGAVTLNGGSSQLRPPENALSLISPVGPFGGWQLPQGRIAVAQQSPRVLVAIAAGENAVDQIIAALHQIGLCVRNTKRGGENDNERRNETEHAVPLNYFV